MRGSRLLWLVTGIWLLLYAWSFWVFFATPSTGDGFTRGLNRLIAFMQWQAVAAGLAIVIWMMGRRLVSSAPARLATRAPAVLALVPVLAIVLLIVGAQLSKSPAQPPPAQTPMPTTAPTTTPTN